MTLQHVHLLSVLVSADFSFVLRELATSVSLVKAVLWVFHVLLFTVLLAVLIERGFLCLESELLALISSCVLF